MRFNLYVPLICVLTLAGCARVPPGNVGIAVNNIGEDKGVSDVLLGVGYHYTGFFKDLYVFPLTEQNCVWSKPGFCFQTKEGMIVSADIGITFNVNPEKVFDLFRKYRTDLDSILNDFVHNYVRDEVNLAASRRGIEELYGSGKEAFLKEIEDTLKTRLSVCGINVHRIYLVGSVHFPKAVVDALNRKIEATQRAEQRENELREAQAEAQKLLAKVSGETQAKFMQAEAQAKAFLIQAEAEAKAKELLKKQMSPELIEYERIRKWDGRLPSITGSDNMQMQLKIPVNQNLK
jgi:regulator of protease activity HflC (stomatin/prohibitin superfamily)